MIYEYLSYASLGLFLIFILLIIRNHKKGLKQLNYSYLYVADTLDKLLSVETIDHVENHIFQNLNASNKYIEKYIISKTKKETSLVMNLLEALPVGEVLLIEVYNAKRVAIHTLRIPIKANRHLDHIELPKDTVSISLSVYEVAVIDNKPIYKAFYKRYKHTTLWYSIAILYLFLPIGYFLLKYVSEDRFLEMMNLNSLFLGLGIMLGFVVLHNLLINLILKNELKRRFKR